MQLNPPVCPSNHLSGIYSRVAGCLTVLAALLLTLFAPSAVAAPTACNILYTIQPQNSSAFGAAITIQNTGTTAITNWSLTWAFASGQTISSLWNGIESQSGANVTVTNQSYNGGIAASSSLTGIGFNGTWNGSTNAVPTAFSLSGTACSVNGVAPSGGGSFSLKPSATALSIVQGATGTDTITVTDVSPFAGSVTLAASGLPAGVTATFGTNPTTATSVITFTASSSATAGSSTVTITGTSGTLSATTSIALTVTAKPGFTLTPAAATESLAPSGSVTDAITVTDTGGFTGTVTLTATSSNSGITVTVSGATLTIKASSTATGTGTITVTGTSGTTTSTTTIAVTITTAGSFALSRSAATLSITQGATGTDTITVTDVSPFTGSVTLAATGLPTGVTVAYGTNPTATTSVLTFTVASTAVAATSTITITGTSGTLGATTTIALTVTTKPGFTLTPAASTESIAQSASVTDAITITDSGGFTGTVTLTAASSNSGVTVTISGTTLTLKASSTASGTGTITVTGTSGALTATTTIALTVTTASKGSFTLSSSLSLITIVAGSTATDTVLVTPVSGFTGSVSLAVSGLPSGVTASWSANPATASSTLTLTASSTTALGTYNISITGTSGTLSQTVGLELAVTNATAISFTLSVASTTLNVQQNSGIADIVTVNDFNGFTGTVGFNLSGLPSGVTPNFNPSTTATTTLLSLAVGTAVTPGSYTVTIEGTSGTFAAGVNFTLNVSAGSPLNIAWVSPISAIAGSTVTILPGGGGNSFGATQGSSAIYFGSTAATVTSWAVNSIQATVPSLAAGTVNVTAVVNGVTSNAVPFVIAATTPSPTIYNGNATHFGGTGTSAGGCGVPGNIQDTQNYVALNVQNDPGNYTLNLTRPIVAPYLSDIGVWNNGLNCGRYLHVKLGNACEGTNDGTADEPFCRDAADWVADQFNGAELDMVVQDSCQDGNSWCRDDPYHLDLNQNVIDDFVLNGTAVGDLFENWSNRQLIWYFEAAPNYTGDINIYVNQGSGAYATQVILTHLQNGLHGVNYYVNGAWAPGTMVSDNGSVYTILPTVTAGNQYQIQVLDVSGALINSGRIYSFTLPSSCGTNCSSVTQVTYTTSN